MKQRRARIAILACYLACLFGSTAGAITVTIWEQEQGTTRQVLQRLVDKFNSRYRNTKVVLKSVSTESMRNQFSKPGKGIISPDLVLADNDFAGRFRVDGSIRSIKYYTRWQRFQPNVVSAVTDEKGAVWGWPVWQGQQLLLFVNRSKVAKTPTGLDEFLDAAKSHSDPENQIYGLALPLMEPFWLAALAQNHGSGPLEQGRPMFDSTAYIQSLAFLHSLKFTDKVVPPECDHQCTSERFMAGETGMVIDGDWAISAYREALGVQLAIAPIPSLAGGKSSLRSLISGRYLFFPSQLRGYKLQVARRFAEYVTTNAVQKIIVRDMERLPATSAKDVLASVDENSWLKASEEASRLSEALPMHHNMTALWQVMRKHLQRVMTGKVEPKEAAKMMQLEAIALDAKG